MDPSLTSFFDPDVVIEQEASFLGTQGTFHGYGGLIRSAQEMYELFTSIHFVPEELVDAGEMVLAIVTAYARGRESGIEMPTRVVHLWTLRRAKIVSWRVFFDLAAARAAAGLDP
jgi:ketosteroid isomerase-like protein